MTPDLFDALQDIEERHAKLREKEAKLKTKLEREREDLELKRLLVEAANLMRYGTWHHSRSQEVASVKKRMIERARAA